MCCKNVIILRICLFTVTRCPFDTSSTNQSPPWMISILIMNQINWVWGPSKVLNSLPDDYYVNVTEWGVKSRSKQEDRKWRWREENERGTRNSNIESILKGRGWRNALLSEEIVTRVTEAMRGVLFGGLAPDWTNYFPEHWWVDQLRRIRQTLPSTTFKPNSALPGFVLVSMFLIIIICYSSLICVKMILEIDDWVSKEIYYYSHQIHKVD